MIGIPGWMLITAAVFYVSPNACCPYDWVCMRIVPEMVVSDTLIRLLDRKFPTVGKSVDFQARLVAKLSASNYVAKIPLPDE